MRSVDVRTVSCGSLVFLVMSRWLWAAVAVSSTLAVEKFVVKPRLQRVPEGGNAEFTCSSLSTVFWSTREGPISNARVFQTKYHTYKLLIRPVELNHSSYYHCEGTHLHKNVYFNEWGRLEVEPRERKRGKMKIVLLPVLSNLLSYF